MTWLGQLSISERSKLSPDSECAVPCAAKQYNVAYPGKGRFAPSPLRVHSSHFPPSPPFPLSQISTPSTRYGVNWSTKVDRQGHIDVIKIS
jgi:hypothetical protein